AICIRYWTRRLAGDDGGVRLGDRQPNLPAGVCVRQAAALREGRSCMTISSESVPKHDPLAADLTPAGARIQLDEWNRYIPPRFPFVPHIRIGKRWLNIIWAVPIAAVALIIAIAVAQTLREIPAVEPFLQRYPGVPKAQPAVVGFPG